MATILGRSSSTSALSAFAKNKLAIKAKQAQFIEQCPDSFEALLLRTQREIEMKRVDSAKVFTLDSNDVSMTDEMSWYDYDAQNLGSENMLHAAIVHLSSLFRMM